MDLATLQAKITQLARLFTVDMPLREAMRQKSELGCVLLHTQEFFLAEEYTSLLAGCGLSQQAGRDCITYMLKRHAFRWTR